MAELLKYTLEFPINSSITILYLRLSSPSGLSEWFADDVNWKGNVYTFIWNDSSEESAELLKKVSNQFIRFRWMDQDNDTFFEFKIEVDPVTNDVVLLVTDFAKDEEDQENETKLWETQVHALMKRIGS